MKRILGSLDFEACQKYWRIFLDYSGNDFILSQATRDIKTFCAHINRIVQLTKRSTPAGRLGKYDPNANQPALTAEELAAIRRDMF